MRTLTTILLLLLLGVYNVEAQDNADCENSIEGRIFDLESSKPLGFVNIQIENTSLGTTSNEDGFFRIEKLCKKEYDLLFSFVGYKTIKHHHDFHHPFLEIYLAEDNVTLKSVVVEAESSSSDFSTISTTKLSGKELEAVASETLGDIASRVTGVSTLSTGQNVVKPIIHGLHSNRILIINSGVRHEFQNWGIEHAPEIDPSMIDNLEVIKGAATVRYGPDALGGVILLNPPKMELSTPLEGKVGVIGKSNGRSYEGNIELSKGFKWFSLLGGGSYVKQGDLSAPDYILTNTGKEESSYYGSFRIHPFANLDIEGYYSHFEQKLGILTASNFGNLSDLQNAIESDTPLIVNPFSYDINQPFQDVSHDLYKATIRHIGKRQSIELQYGYQFNKRQEFGVRRAEAPNIDLELVTESLDLDYRHPNFGGLSGRIGVQWQRQANDNQPGTNTVPFVPNYDSERIGVYLIETLKLGSSSIEAGIRYDYMDAFIVGREPDNTIYRNNILYENITATLGFRTDLGEGHSFLSNVGIAWRPPNVAELYSFGQHFAFLEYGLWRYTINEQFDFISTSGGILTEEDRAVPAEVGYKWISTYELNKENVRAELTAHINYIANFINSNPAGVTRTPRGNFVFFTYDQQDALLWGIDASVELKHSERFSSDIKASYLWTKNLDDNSNFVGMPPPKIDYLFSFTPKIKGFHSSRLDIGLSYTFEAFQQPRVLTVDEFLFANTNGINRFTEDATDFDIVPPPDGFLLADIFWTMKFKQFNFQFQLRNMFNTTYRSYTNRLRYFADEIGRNVIVGLSYEF